MLTTLAISNYRSLRNLVVPIKQLNVVTGANGSGKSSLYRALRLLADTAQGRVVSSVAREGGLQSTLWAGPEMTSRADVEAITRFRELEEKKWSAFVWDLREKNMGMLSIWDWRRPVPQLFSSIRRSNANVFGTDLLFDQALCWLTVAAPWFVFEQRTTVGL